MKEEVHQIFVAGVIYSVIRNWYLFVLSVDNLVNKNDNTRFPPFVLLKIRKNGPLLWLLPFYDAVNR
jgi:hypothetical protein